VERDTTVVPDLTDRRQPSIAPVITIGSRILRYDVLALIGEGGMGTVYRAHDSRLGRDVALKVVRAELNGSSGHARLLAEAQAMARLSHPNVVAVYDVGEIEARVFIAMELVDGQTLRSWTHAMPRSRREILHVFVRSGRGLAAAHRAGLVHRDFKPDNVLVGGDGRVRVADFGLAASGMMPPTPGGGSGTPAYMAPEQHGRGTVDGRADQFAFAVALYEALYRRHPFAAATTAEQRENILAGAVGAAPPSAAVPAWLRAVLLRALAVAPEDRFPTMDELLEALGRDPAAARRRWLGLAAVATLSAAAALVVGRRPAAPPCAGAAARLAGAWDDTARRKVRDAFLASGLPIADESYRRTAAVLDAYAAAWVAMRADACAATEIRHEQSAKLLDLRMHCLDRRLVGLREVTALFADRRDPRVVVRAAQAARALDPLERCADAAALEAAVPPPDDPAVRARVAALRPRLDKLTAMYRAGAYQDALLPAKLAADEARTIPYAPLQAEAVNLAARMGRGASENAYAEAALHEALPLAAAAHDDQMVLEIWTNLVSVVGFEMSRPADALAMRPAVEAAVARVDDDHAARARALAAFGSVLQLAGRLEESRQDHEAALAVLARAGIADSHLADVLMTYGVTLSDEGKLDEATAALQRGLAIYVAAYGPEHPNAVGTRNNLGIVQLRQHKLDAALASFQLALTGCERAAGVDHPACVVNLSNVATVEFAQGRIDDALTVIQRALAIKERAFGPDAQATLIEVNNAGEALFALGRYDEALAYHRRALEARARTFGPDSVRTAYSMVRVGVTLVALGRPAEARALLERALATHEKTAGLDQGLVAADHDALGDVALAEHRADAALAQHRRAIEIRRAHGGAEDSDLADSLEGEARALLALGRSVEAAAELERAVTIREREGGDPVALAGGRFLLARALGHCARGRELAGKARADLAAAGARARGQLDEVDAWLK
jgi:serine/threonine-protein kinase